MFFLVSLVFKTDYLLVLDIDQILTVQDLDTLTQVFGESSLFLCVLLHPSIYICQITVKERRNEVMVDIVKRLREPA